MLSYGTDEFHGYRFDPQGEGLVVEYFELVKKRDKQRREYRELKVLKKLTACVHHFGQTAVRFTQAVKFVDFSTVRVSSEKTVKIVEKPAGEYILDVITIDLPSKIGEGLLEIVLIPGTFLGVAQAGVETLLRKQERRESHPSQTNQQVTTAS